MTTTTEISEETKKKLQMDTDKHREILNRRERGDSRDIREKMINTEISEETKKTSMLTAEIAETAEIAQKKWNTLNQI